jgi:hypothetical protein
MPGSILYILQVLSVGHNDSDSIRRDTTHQPNKTNTQLTILEYVVILDIFSDEHVLSHGLSIII